MQVYLTALSMVRSKSSIHSRAGKAEEQENLREHRDGGAEGKVMSRKNAVPDDSRVTISGPEPNEPVFRLKS